MPLKLNIPRGTWIAIGVTAIAALAGSAFFAIRPTGEPLLPEPEPTQPDAQPTPQPPVTFSPAPPALPSTGDLASEGALIQYLDKIGALPAAPRPPKNLDPAQLEIDRRAREDFKQGKMTEAADAYHKILQTSPSNAHALANLAAILARQGNPKEALEFASRAVQAEPGDAFARTTLGSVQDALGRDQEALQNLAGAAALDPANPEVRLFIGVAASGLKWAALAERQLLEAIRLDPGYAEAHLNLAILYATAKPPLTDRAKKHLDRARALGAPVDPQLERLLSK